LIYPRRGPRCSWAVSCGSQGQPNPSASHSYDWPVIAVWGLRSFNFGSLRFVRPGMGELIEQANWLPAPDGGFYLNLRLFGPDDSLKNGTGCRRKSKSFSHPKARFEQRGSLFALQTRIRGSGLIWGHERSSRNRPPGVG
jgi:hypothetical protein